MLSIWYATAMESTGKPNDPLGRFALRTWAMLVRACSVLQTFWQKKVWLSTRITRQTGVHRCLS